MIRSFRQKLWLRDRKGDARLHIVELEIDVEHAMKVLGTKASHNKGKRSALRQGGLKVKVQEVAI